MRTTPSSSMSSGHSSDCLFVVLQQAGHSCECCAWPPPKILQPVQAQPHPAIQPIAGSCGSSHLDFQLSCLAEPGPDSMLACHKPCTAGQLTRIPGFMLAGPEVPVWLCSLPAAQKTAPAAPPPGQRPACEAWGLELRATPRPVGTTCSRPTTPRGRLVPKPAMPARCWNRTES